MISIFDHIGRPEILDSLTLSTEQLELEITKLHELFKSVNVKINRPNHLSAKGYYEFLTDVFFNRKFTPIVNKVSSFKYSNLRHDGPEFIKTHAEAFVLELLNLKSKFYGARLSEICRSKKELVTKDEAIGIINDFRGKWDKIVINGFSADRTKLSDTGMYFIFGVVWQGWPKGGGEPEIHEGLGACQMELKDCEWWVKGFMMPGFQV